MVTLLEKIDPSYYKDFIYLDIRSRKCIYAEANKSIYGTLEASLLFWKNSPRSWEIGILENEYDWCVMKNIVKDKQCTIL